MLFEDWNKDKTRTTASAAVDEDQLDEEEKAQDAAYGGGAEEDTPMFEVVQQQLNVSKDQGAIVSVAVGNNVMLVGTQNCHLIRNMMDQEDYWLTVISRKQEDVIHKVFMDPTGFHGLISMQNGSNWYLHSKSTKVKPLAKIKGVIESIAWDKYSASDKTTGKLLLGLRNGHIYETSIEGDNVKYYNKLADLNEPDAKEPVPISGLYAEIFPGSGGDDAPSSSSDAVKYFVMAATPTRHYQFIGGPTFKEMFDRYTSTPSFLELPGDIENSELHFFAKNPQARAKSCAWLTGAGIYYGNLVFGSQDQPGDKVVDDGKLLSYPVDLLDARNTGVIPGSLDITGSPQVLPPTPVSMALSEFHFLLLYPKRLIAINQLSEEVVFEESFADKPYGNLKGLTTDASRHNVWMFSDRYVFQVLVDREDREVWSLYLRQGKFDLALEYCHEDDQEETVRSAQADHCFLNGAFEMAAEIYAQTKRSFEEVSLKFVNSNARTALKTYLTRKLERLKKNDMTQQLMLCTWLTEIYLDKLNALKGKAASESVAGRVSDAIQLDDRLEPAPSPDAVDVSDQGETYEAVLMDFHEFLDTYHDVLNRSTTTELISSHGRVDDLLYYAELTLDLDWVISHHLRHGHYHKALARLKDHPAPHKIEELYYKFCPELMQHIPKETVDMLIKIKKISPAKLIPALMRYETALQEAQRRNRSAATGTLGNRAVRSSATSKASDGRSGGGRRRGGTDASDMDDVDDEDAADWEEEFGDGADHHAIRYLEVVIHDPENQQDQAIYNYLVSLYAKQPDENKLLDFIEEQANVEPMRYDYKYALRLCHQERKARACVAIYSVMHLYEEAVKLALTVDVDLAKDVVRRAEDVTDVNPALEDAEKKRLWLLIARHVIEQGKDITQAMVILDQCPLLKIDDILPYFPDFVKIGDFKEEICQSLEKYNEEIDKLKEEMDDYTRSADLIRKDIHNLRNRNGFVTSNQRCELCSQPVLTRQFLLFPCLHVFHIDCLTQECHNYLKKNPRRVADVLREFGPVAKSAAVAAARAPPAVASTASRAALKSATSSPPTASPAASLSATGAIQGPIYTLPPLITAGGAGAIGGTGGGAGGTDGKPSDRERKEQSTLDALFGFSGGERKERERERDQHGIVDIAVGGGAMTFNPVASVAPEVLEAFAASECLCCGSMMIESVQEPFIALPDEEALVRSWAIEK